jgi:hypothetical protein
MGAVTYNGKKPWEGGDAVYVGVKLRARQQANECCGRKEQSASRRKRIAI